MPITIWLKFAQPKVDDLKELNNLKFKHLLTGHGEPLLDEAQQAVAATMGWLFSICGIAYRWISDCCPSVL